MVSLRNISCPGDSQTWEGQLVQLNCNYNWTPKHDLPLIALYVLQIVIGNSHILFF